MSCFIESSCFGDPPDAVCWVAGWFCAGADCVINAAKIAKVIDANVFGIFMSCPYVRSSPESALFTRISIASRDLLQPERYTRTEIAGSWGPELQTSTLSRLRSRLARGEQEC